MMINMQNEYEIKQIINNKIDEAIIEILDGCNTECRYIGYDTISLMTESVYNILEAVFDVQRYIDNEV